MNTEIHRLLDEAFAGVEMTPDAQDLKEEIRADLMARVAELEGSGLAGHAAASRAVAELGDIAELVHPAGAERPDRPGEAGGSGQAGSVGFGGAAASAAAHRVRPRPGFVVRVVVWSIAVAVGIVLGVLGASGVLPLPTGVLVALLGVAATGSGLIVGDSLAQETTASHPLPSERAGGYALATFLAVYGLGLGGAIALHVLPAWVVVFAALGVIGAIILYTFLGATQTNRRKAWTRTAFAGMPPSRFEREPEAAARFGIYTVAIWLVTLGVMAVLVFTVGWWWAPVAFVGGLAVMMLVLARMLFGTSPAGR